VPSAAPASKSKKCARVEEAAPVAKAVAVDAPSTVVVAPPAPIVLHAPPPAPPPPVAQRPAVAPVVVNNNIDDNETDFASAHRDYISARRPGRRVGASAAFAAAAEPLRCSHDEVDEARAALSALPPKRANAKAQRRAAIEARFPQWREWMR